MDRSSTVQGLAAAVLLVISSPQGRADEALYQGFRNPPRKHGIMPYWAWNGRMEPEKVREQIRRMTEQGVFGAYVFGFDGLRTPYLSEEWVRNVAAGLDESRKRGFSLGFVTDYMWPQGDFRDIWNLEPPQSHIIRERPEFMRRRLKPVERIVEGPVLAEMTGLQRPLLAVAGRLRADGAMEEQSLQVISEGIAGDRFRWEAPAGRWRVMIYCLEDHPMERLNVDLMNREAVGLYIERVLGEQYRRFKPYFGNVIPSAVSDHEGEIGYRIAWTDGLFEKFERAKAYRLEKFLPLLAFEGERMTEKVRCDYMDVIAELYATNYWGQVSGWLKERGVLLTGHEWEESLMASAAYQGDFMRCQRNMSMPGIDSLWNFGESPRHFKEAASVAHFMGKPFWVENQILQGRDSFISPEKMRYGTNLVALWGATQLTPWFGYSDSITNFPPMWDWRQPFWKYFHHYADYARRLSFMNDSRHVAPVLLYHPLTTVWAHSDPVFDEKKWNYQRSMRLYHPDDPDTLHIYGFDWKNQAVETEDAYFDLMNRLPAAQWDFDVADDYFLDQARVGRGVIEIGGESFRAIVVPPVSTMRRAALAKIHEFWKQGGVVIATGRLPSISMDEGRDDAEIARIVKEMFGEGTGGRAYFVGKDLGRVVALLDDHVAKDFRLLEGSAENLYYARREKEGAAAYFVVNNTPQARKLVVETPVRGSPEKWNAEDGSRAPLFHSFTRAGTRVRLELGPWEAFHVVFGPETAKKLSGSVLVADETAAIDLGSDGWEFRPLGDTVQVPYALAEDGQEEWLSAERLTVTEWLCLGPFEAPRHQAFVNAYGPETDGFQVLRDRSYNSTSGDGIRWTACGQRGPAPAEYVAHLKLPGLRGGAGAAAYAATFVYAYEPRNVRLEISADAAKVWVNRERVLSFHDMPASREDRSAFAHEKAVRLRAGWNEILLKLEFDRAQTAFYFRLADVSGGAAKGLQFALQPGPAPPAVERAAGGRIYRVAVPPGVTGLRVLGGSVKPVSGATMELREMGTRYAPLEFVAGVTQFRLGSWSDTGLKNYSGSASYEKSFRLPDRLRGRKLMLDCGEVGVVAEVWVNGRRIGERVWKPFRFDITGAVRPGENRLRIVVTNTEASARAVANHRGLLPNIRLNGLLGPVTITPYDVIGKPLREGGAR
ncbi:MAG: hypothetical protein HY858_09455 [Candidatus Solibacter usitatus]|nr:hypothetical protein [Candidatus Solibacter usitatus]